jgi:LmbE family N-acetylglucosaminyl deacetylase
MKFYLLLFTTLCSFSLSIAQPDPPVEEWTGKTILVIGAHPDDDSQAHGTLAMLKENGNEIYILLMTTGNVGTKDPKLSKSDLARIRRQEQLDAMKAIGLDESHYINLGYDDGRLEFADREEAVGQLVYYIRKIKPDVLFSFDPGYNYQVWHKSDHRAAAYLTADAVRAAEWPLMYENQLIHDGVEAHLVPEFIFFGGNTQDKNTTVVIDDYVDKKVEAGVKYVSQWSSGWDNYLGSSLDDYPKGEKEAVYERIRNRVAKENGKYVEHFRHHKGLPDSMGHAPRN